MLRSPLAAAAALIVPALFAQDGSSTTTLNALGQEVTVTYPSSFQITPPMSEWPEMAEDGKEEAMREIENDRRHHPLKDVVPPEMPDPVLQTAPATRQMRAPIINFNGLTSSGYPPDPTGSVGPDRYVQAVNTAFRVYQKTGTPAASQHNLNFLWPGESNDGDPIVMYDRHADRWFISQFNLSPNRMLIAVSQTSDSNGAYYTWSYNFSQFPDYPKFSVWWDGYYMTSNSNKSAVVFERPAMLTGSPTARMTALTAPSVINDGFTSVLPADADGAIPPNGTPCYFFNLEDNSWGGVPSDRMKIYEMSTDWVNTSNTSVSLSQTLNTASFDATWTWSWDDIAQPGTTQRLDAIGEVFNYRAQHMRFANHSSIMLCHVTDVGSSHAGVRWYELRDANDGNWSIYQQGTWAPDAAHRWLGSIAMDAQGNIGLAYSYSYPSQNGYPGLRYTGRYASDPLGVMTVVEQNAISGSGSQEGFNRYGDYSHMSLDPNGSTFWFTGEYLGTGGSPRTRIFSFDLAEETGVEQIDPYYANVDLRVTNNDGFLNVTIDGLYTNEQLTYDVLGLDGRALIHEDAKPVANAWSTRTDIRSLAPAVYFVRLGNPHFQKVARLVIADKQ